MYNNIKVIKRVYYARNKTCILYTQKHSPRYTGTLSFLGEILNFLQISLQRSHKLGITQIDHSGPPESWTKMPKNVTFWCPSNIQCPPVDIKIQIVIQFNINWRYP